MMCCRASFTRISQARRDPRRSSGARMPNVTEHHVASSQRKNLRCLPFRRSGKQRAPVRSGRDRPPHIGSSHEWPGVLHRPLLQRLATIWLQEGRPHALRTFRQRLGKETRLSAMLTARAPTPCQRGNDCASNIREIGVGQWRAFLARIQRSNQRTGKAPECPQLVGQ